MRCQPGCRRQNFNPLSPCGERPGGRKKVERTEKISTHSLRVERDLGGTNEGVLLAVFQPTLSVWRETQRSRVGLHPTCISTHSLRVERDSSVLVLLSATCISTHSLRVERDQAIRQAIDRLEISTHSLRVERDYPRPGTLGRVLQFQPTLSVWRETPGSAIIMLRTVFQPTLSVWRETSARSSAASAYSNFNPLSPCGERLTAATASGTKS